MYTRPITWSEFHKTTKQAGVMSAIRSVGPAFAKARGFFKGLRAPAAAPAARPVATATSGAGTAMRSAAPVAGSIPANAGHVPSMASTMGNFARRAGGVATAPLSWMGSHPKLMGGLLSTTFGGEMLGDIHNQFKANQMMDNNIQDHMSGVSQGAAGALRGLADAPWLQRAAFLMAPQQALNSRTLYDQMAEKLNGMGGKAQAYAPGIMAQIQQHLQPGAKLTSPTPSAGDLTLFQLQQEQQRLQRLRSSMLGMFGGSQGTQASAIPAS